MVQEAGWAPGPVWTGAENLDPHRDSIPAPSSPQQVAIQTELPGPRPHRRHHSYSQSLLERYQVLYFLCFQHVIRFHGIGHKCNFIYAQNESTAFLTPISTKVTNAQKDYVPSSGTEFHSNRIINLVSKNRNSFTPGSEVRLALRRFSWKSQCLNKVLWTSLHRLGRRVWKVRGKMSFTPLGKARFSPHRSLRTRTCCTVLLYRISSKSVKKCGRYV
jgi:hypothetical protein